MTNEEKAKQAIELLCKCVINTIQAIECCKELIITLERDSKALDELAFGIHNGSGMKLIEKGKGHEHSGAIKNGTWSPLPKSALKLWKDMYPIEELETRKIYHDD